MKTMRNAVSLFLLTAIITGVLAGCADNAEPTVTSAESTDTPEETGPATDAEGFILDDLPDDLDFGGRTIMIMGWNHYEDVEFYAEEQTGDIVNDAYFDRNLAVEDRLNVKLEFFLANARYDGDNSFVSYLQSSVLSGSGEYDIVAAHSHRMGNSASQGLLLNLNDVDYLNFDMPWWRQSLREATTIGGVCYFATGDISVSSLSRMQGIFFNNQLIDEFGLESPYDLVLSGDWTIDKMGEMSVGVYSDLNDNDKKDEGDRFGFCTDSVQLQAVYYTSGLRAIVHDESGKLMLSPNAVSDRSVGIIDKLCNLLHATNDSTKIQTVDDDKIFREGRGMFYAFPLGLISSAGLREATFEFGFVPWPKYDAADTEYITSSSNAYSIWGIPLDAKEPDISGAVMEALASGGYRTITPALFETAYKVKYNNINSQRQSEIFDMMRENIVYDIGRIFVYDFPFLTNGFSDMIFANKNTWVSTYESNRSGLEESLAKFEESFIENAAW